LEGLRATHDRLSHPAPRYTRAEFDRWFAGYDAIIEIPCFFGTDLLYAYADDPDIKFVLYERSPASWVRSLNNFAGKIVTDCESFPMNILHHFNRKLDYLWRINVDVYNVWASGTRPGQPQNIAVLEDYYTRYIRDVKRIIPEDRLLVCKLEDGLGWEKLCNWLEVDVPPKDVPYPREVSHEKLKNELFLPLVMNAAMKLGLTILVPAVAAGAWWRYWR
jgi:hypothetical protein